MSPFHHMKPFRYGYSALRDSWCTHQQAKHLTLITLSFLFTVSRAHTDSSQTAIVNFYRVLALRATYCPVLDIGYQCATIDE
ncbi:TPA: hypothetical protein NJ348_000003 [Vibrio parahaemolyticus]|nr:hypothetical protein [Vibrio parahaemolyticus]HCG7142924.1 hypothetical protein [Vibrio parahaemolyticus]